MKSMSKRCISVLRNTVRVVVIRLILC